MTPPSDIMKQILFFSNPFHDFSSLIRKTNELILIAILHSEVFNKFAGSTLALGCLLAILEDLKFFNFS